MRKSLITLHRWLGFPLGVLFIVTFGTGCLTAIDELLQRLSHSQHSSMYTYQATTAQEDAQMIEAITQGKKGTRRIIMPSLDTPYYQVVLRGETWTYAIGDSLNGVHAKQEKNVFFDTVLQLHRNYLLGKEGVLGIGGKHYAAWVGISALLLSLLGLWLWWPRRAKFSFKDAVPQGRKRKHFFTNHMANGVITLIAVLLLAFTGASITYRDVSQYLFGINKQPSHEVVKQTPQKLDENWQAWIEAAYARMPEGAHLEQINYPRKAKKGRSSHKEKTKQASARLSFQFSTPDDWFGLVRSSVVIDKRTATLVEVNLFNDLAFNEKLYGLMKPLHTGRHLPAPYVGVLLVFSILGMLMVFSGVASFLLKKRKPLFRRKAPIKSTTR